MSFPWLSSLFARRNSEIFSVLPKVRETKKVTAIITYDSLNLNLMSDPTAMLKMRLNHAARE
jgi:hypothetical protein